MHIKKAKCLFKMYDFIFINRIMTEKLLITFLPTPQSPSPSSISLFCLYVGFSLLYLYSFGHRGKSLRSQPYCGIYKHV